ncbi:MAG: hypothetical protein QM802_12310 [Agriterribacter sp.]
MLTFLNAFIIFLFYVVPLLGQNRTDFVRQLNFDVIRNGKVVGRMVCNKYKKNDTTAYLNESTIHISLIIDVAIYNRVEGTFVHDLLCNGSMRRIVNGTEKIDNHIKKANDKYLVTGDGKSGEVNAAINYTTVCLMHTEPENISQVFSENFRQFVGLKKIAAHKYALQLPDGNENYYTYKDGNCIEVEVPTTFTTIYIKPCR